MKINRRALTQMNSTNISREGSPVPPPSTSHKE